MTESQFERRGWRLLGFAWAMHQMNRGYERQVAVRKRPLFEPLAGTVVEIGPGTGPNFGYLPRGVRWIGIEPNVHMHPYLKNAAREHGIDVELRPGLAEALPLEDASADAVISTLVLCSVPNLDGALREIRRVLKPGGRFVFVEHVAAPPGTWLRRVQGWAGPINAWLGDGCHADRETWRNIEGAGFSKVELEHARMATDIASPHIFGTAFN